MSESRVLAPCRDCGKSFRVPAAGKKYRCKCGGVIDATEIAEPQTAPAQISEEPEAADLECPSCSAMNQAGAKFCDECGEDLAARSRPAKAGKLSRQQVGVEMKRARKSISLVKTLFTITAVFSGVGLLVLYGLLFADRAVTVDPALWSLVVLLTLQLALATTGALRVHIEPFLWAVLLASLSTLGLALDVVNGEDLNPLRIGWTLLMWALVPATVRVRRILKEHPDHYAVQALQGTYADARSSRGKSKGQMDDRRAEELRRLSGQRVTKRTFTALGVVVGGSAILAGTVWMRRPATSDATVSAFVEDWNAGDLDALGERFNALDYKLKDKWDRLMAGPLAGDLPSLGEPAKTELEENRAEIHWETDGGPVALRLHLTEGEWIVNGFVPPLPPLGDLPQTFQIAWNSGTLSRVTDLCFGDSKDRLTGMLPQLAESREWLSDGRPDLPKLSSPELRNEGSERCDYLYDSEVGEFRATFRIVESGGWALTSIKPPRR